MDIDRDKFLFLIAAIFILHGTAHIYGVGFYIGKTDRPRGKNCNYLNTVFQERKIYYSHKESLGRCSFIHVEK